MRAGLEELMRNVSILSLIVGLAGIATPAMGAALPDGVYYCAMYSGTMLMHLGDIAISGNTYQGPAYDGNYEGSYTYEVTDGGTINWAGPLGGFDLDGNTVVSTVLKADGNNVAFDVMIQLESGNFSTVSCTPE
jgi:hypothetical protein